jgi:hypothetical protein
MADNKTMDKKHDRGTNGEQNAQRGSQANDPNKHDQGSMAGKEWTNGQSDAQRERRREDQQTDVNEEAL